ncbi:helix-turn-helix transcriptional regulator [Streptomyces kronopolitis]|uniref:helix-turn-helix transcriptional regulator n=1 Tax=Streptomyces kronopolitis TaxID=1612435 RepID=UPI0036A86327
MGLLSGAVGYALADLEALPWPDAEISRTLQAAVWLEIAHWYWRRQATDDALRALREALVAAPHGLRCLFVDSQHWCRELMLAYAGERLGRNEYVRELLALMGEKPGYPEQKTESGTRDVPFTRRELDFLRLLPEMMTVDEMAGSEHVSINTVKTHLKSIYRKLGVGDRRSGVRVAQQLGLL